MAVISRSSVRTGSTSARRFLVGLHVWLGLLLGGIWALQGLTGAALVFHRELDRPVEHVAQGPMRPVGELLAAVQARTGTKPSSLGVADARGDVLSAAIKRQGEDWTVRLEAASGRIIDARPAESGWRWLYKLHEELLLGDRGQTLIGLSGVLLLSAALTGLWAGWPRRAAWRAALQPSRWRTTRQRLFGWHRLTGLAATVALALLSLTGMAMAFGKTLSPLLGRTPPKVAAVSGPPASADAVLAAARARFPDARFVRITLPNEKNQSWQVRLRQPGEARAWSGVTSVRFDQTGRITQVYDPRSASFANRLYDAAFPLHNGELLGLAGRILVILAGLSLPALWLTGLLAWLRKRRRVVVLATPLKPSPA